MQGRGLVTVQGAPSGPSSPGEDDGPWVEIAVHDDGPGIQPELHDRIFEFSFSRTASSRAGNLGFGLWWVKSLMVRLGGAVTVESDGRHGTTFYLRLPRDGRQTTDDGPRTADE
jgi:signal transduction histidine kinase